MIFDPKPDPTRKKPDQTHQTGDTGRPDTRHGSDTYHNKWPTDKPLHRNLVLIRVVCGGIYRCTKY